MAPLDTSTWLRTRQDAAFPYETSRQDLAQTLHERTTWIGERDRHLPHAAEQAAQRAALAKSLPRYFGPLTRYVQREVTRWEERGLVPPGTAAVDDIVIATFVAALEQAGVAPAQGIYDWLRRIGRQEALVARLDEEARQRYEVSLESPVVAGGAEERGLVLRLIDVLADPKALLPEQILANEAVRRALDRALAKLPERWREAFLLHAVDGWSTEEIATAEGFAPTEAPSVLAASRFFLARMAGRRGSVAAALKRETTQDGADRAVCTMREGHRRRGRTKPVRATRRRIDRCHAVFSRGMLSSSSTCNRTSVPAGPIRSLTAMRWFRS